MAKREYKKVEYKIFSEKEAMSYLERHNYSVDEYNLRRDMRALIAYQDNPLTVNGEDKLTINSVAKRCGLEQVPTYVNSRIMEVFLGQNTFNSFAKPLYEAKAKYDALPIDKKKEAKDPKSPIDYFSLPTLYHFYRFRNEILDLMKANNFARSGTVKLADFDKILNTAKANYLDKSDYNNMYYNPQSDIMIESTPLTSYTSIKELQRRIDENGINGEEINVPADKLIKAEVTGYMLSYVDKIKNLSKGQMDEIRGLYTTYSRRYIDKNMPAIRNADGTVIEPKSRLFMLEMCNYGGNVYEAVNHIGNKESSSNNLTAEEVKEIAKTGYGYEKETGQFTLIK